MYAGSQYVNDYIKQNSGCFLYEGDEIKCKVKELSCCQPDPVPELPFCNWNLDNSFCNGYDEEKEDSCCQFCDCQHHTCLPNQELKCRRPTVGEALTYFSDKVSDNVFGFKLFDASKKILIGTALLIAAIIFWKLFL